jgi:hypothetical protein
VEPDATVDQAQKFLAAHLRESEAIPFYVLMKRYAAAHAPRKAAEPEVPPPAPVEAGETVHAERNSDSTHSAAKEKKAAPAAVAPRKPQTRQTPRKHTTSAAKKRRPPARRHR